MAAAAARGGARRIVGVALVGCLLAACSSGSSSSATTAPDPAIDATAPTSDASPGSGPVLVDGTGADGTAPVATASTGTPSAPTDPADPRDAPLDVAALGETMRSLRTSAPAEPLAGARALVDVLRSAPEPLRADAAVAELLRRAGFPIVATDGSVVALPDDAAWSDMPVYAEMVPNVARSVLAGELYSADAVGRALADIGAADGPMPWEQLALTVSHWGKDRGAPAFIASAAATVRALSGTRGQVFSALVDPAAQGIDALQLLILVGHGAGVAVPVPEGPLAGAGSIRRASSPARRDGPCDALKQALSTEDATQFDKLTLAVGQHGFSTYADSVLQYYEVLSKLPGHERTAVFVKSVKGAGKAYDVLNKAASYASLVILLLGTSLDLSTDKLSTHYKHEPGSTAEDVWATAYAEFHSGLAQQRLACYGLAGLDVPKNGPISGMHVKWSLGQELAPSGSDIAKSAHLRPTSASVARFQDDVTNADGIAEIHLKPPVEDERTPKTGTQHRAAVVLTAHLEKQDVPFSLADLAAVLQLDPRGAVIAKTIDALKSIAVDEMLPTAQVKLSVTFHGAEPVVAKVDNSVFLLLYTIPRVYADLVSCSGIEGPFTGMGGYSTISLDAVGEMGNPALGALGLPMLPASSPAQDNPVSVMAPPPGAAPVQFPIALGDEGKPFVDGLLSIDASAASATEDPFGWVVYDIGDGRLGKRVGSLELLMAGSSWPFSDLTATVYRVESDPRCPPSNVRFDDD